MVGDQRMTGNSSVAPLTSNSALPLRNFRLMFTLPRRQRSKKHGNAHIATSRSFRMDFVSPTR